MRLIGGLCMTKKRFKIINTDKFSYKFKIVVDTHTGVNYLFAIALVDNNETATIITDTVKVAIPSISLPYLAIWPITTEGRKITINWKYKNNIADLAGFRVYMNNTLLANEQTVGKELRSWTTKELEPGKYTFQIEAITSFGVVSPRSQKIKAEIKNEN